MIELVRERGRLVEGFGGDTLNAALYLARLLKDRGVTVSYVTRLGDDAPSRAMLRAWRADGIDCALVEQVPNRCSGRYWIDVDKRGERVFTYDRSRSPAREMFLGDAAALVDKLRRHDALYVSGITLAILHDTGRRRLLHLMKAMKDAGKQVIYDTNHRPALWDRAEGALAANRAALRAATLALPSREDLAALFGLESTEDCLDMLTGLAIPEIVLKQGAEPVHLVCEGRREVVAVQPVEKPVDTTAAGDSFNAGYIAGRVLGESPLRATRRAIRLSRLVIGHRGALVPAKAMAAALQ
jgi:2-dehydro-3-deoxygluconokinase